MGLPGCCTWRVFCEEGTQMKKIWTFFLLLVFCFSISVPALAEDGAGGFADAHYRLQDSVGVLTEEENSEIQNLLDETSVQLQFDLAVVVVDTLDGRSAQEWADDSFDSGQFGYGSNKDGALLLISTVDRTWAISTCGYGITAFTDAGIQYIGEQMRDDLAAGNYAEAFRTFARQGGQFVTMAREGRPFDSSDLPKKPLSWIWLIISPAIGFVVAIIVVGSMKRQLRTVRRQAAAGGYVREGSMNVTESKDLFLYHTIDRTEKAKNTSSGSSTHTSSSGTTHGGGSGKF